jgi:dTDP-4-dehydrorhamnose reductase
MRVLLTGCGGQLAWEILRQTPGYPFEISGCDLPEVDISNPHQIDALFDRLQPRLVIKTAAYTQVDQAEKETERAFAANAAGPANLAAACTRLDVPLIHISTDFVFDGQKQSPYGESDPVAPLSVYGRSKAEGEAMVRSRLEKHVILRTSWLYGAHGHNFVKTMLRLSREKEVLSVVDDQYGCPTSAADLAATVLALADRHLQGAPTPWGTYHYCGQGITSWYGFAQKIFELAAPLGFQKRARLEPLPSARYPSAAARPPFSALDCGRIREKFGIDPNPWPQSLETTLRVLLPQLP